MVKIRIAPKKATKLTGAILIFCFFNIFYLGYASAANSPPQTGTVEGRVNGSIVAESHAGGEVIFTSTYIDKDGYSDIGMASLIFIKVGQITSDYDKLRFIYDQYRNKFYIVKWGMGGQITDMASPGESKILDVRNARLDCSKTQVSGSGDTLTVTWAITFKDTFTGDKTTHEFIEDKQMRQNAGGYAQVGTWKINPYLLSISINPKAWDIGSIEINKTITMTPVNKITVANNGGGPETFTLSLINPPGWAASTAPGINTFVASGLFCNSMDMPIEADFNQNSFEDAISTAAKKATSAIFGYSPSTANGVSVPSGSDRSLYLQFKSPTVTDKQTEQQISVIVSCQTP